MANEPDGVEVTLAWAKAPRVVELHAYCVAPGTTIDRLLDSSGLLKSLDAASVRALEVSVWGRKAALDHMLRAGDRVELTRALVVDPKIARRERFARQGSRRAGLFAKPQKVPKPSKPKS